MGSPKGLLKWRGTTLLEYQMNSLLQGGCDKVVVVTGKYDTEMSPLLKDRPRIIRSYNPKYLEGKTTSIKAGVWVLPDDINSIVLLAVDQPRPAWVIEKVLRLHADFKADVTSPGFDGQGGHPIVFDARLRYDLMNITEEDEGVRAIFRKPDIEHHRVKFDSAIVRLDINTPEAYKNALTAYTELAKSKL